MSQEAVEPQLSAEEERKKRQLDFIRGQLFADAVDGEGRPLDWDADVVGAGWIRSDSEGSVTSRRSCCRRTPTP